MKAYLTGQSENNKIISEQNEKNKPENRINDKMNHLLSKYLSYSDNDLIKYISEIKSTIFSSEFKFTPERYASLLELSRRYNNIEDRNLIQDRDFPNEIERLIFHNYHKELHNDPALLKILIGNNLTNVLTGNKNWDLKQEDILFGINEVYNLGGFEKQVHFQDLEIFFRYISMENTKQECKLVFENIRTKHEKEWIYKTYFSAEPDSNCWKELLVQNYPSDYKKPTK